MPFNQYRDQIAALGLEKPDGFNAYAAGNKQYGLSGSSAATSGPISAQGMAGYRARTQNRTKTQDARKAAVLNRMQAAQQGQYATPDYLRGVQ